MANIRIQLIILIAIVLLQPAMHYPASAQENLGTAMGIPNNSPGVLWPKGSSLESLGTGRLYPNGPEFGLSNTSGGFGLTGTGRITGIGLAQRSIPGLVESELEKPYTLLRHLDDAFSSENSRSSALFSTATATQFRTQIQRGSIVPTWESPKTDKIIQPYQLPGIDSVLQDRPATPDAVLKTGL